MIIIQVIIYTWCYTTEQHWRHFEPQFSDVDRIKKVLVLVNVATWRKCLETRGGGCHFQCSPVLVTASPILSGSLRILRLGWVMGTGTLMYTRVIVRWPWWSKYHPCITSRPRNNESGQTGLFRGKFCHRLTIIWKDDEFSFTTDQFVEYRVHLCYVKMQSKTNNWLLSFMFFMI